MTKDSLSQGNLSQEKVLNFANKILIMMQMQDSMNTRVNLDWRQQGFSWYRAIWTECAEMLDHYGWKWWKHQSPDLEQVKLELVDIFHFGLSCSMIRQAQLKELANSLNQDFLIAEEGQDFTESLEQLALYALKEHSFSMYHFSKCMKSIHMSLDDLYRQYIGKNTLNFFRQDHGYKEGSYIKVWQDREDNEHLSEILHRLDSEATDYREQVYFELKKRYPG